MEEHGIVEDKLAAAGHHDQDALDEEGEAEVLMGQIGDVGNSSQKVIDRAAANETGNGVSSMKLTSVERGNEGRADTTHEKGTAFIAKEAKSPADGTATAPKLTSDWLLESEILAFANQDHAAEPLVSQGSATDRSSVDATVEEQLSVDATTDQQLQRDSSASDREQSHGNGSNDAEVAKEERLQYQEHLDVPLNNEEDDSSLDSSKKKEKYEAVVKSIKESLHFSLDDQESQSKIETDNPGDGTMEGDTVEQLSTTDDALSALVEPAVAEPFENNTTLSSTLNADLAPHTKEPGEKLTYRESLVKSLREKFEKGPNYDVHNLSVDLEEFYVAQRAQNAEYKTKRREAFSRIHGAEEVHGNGTGTVDHSPRVSDKGKWNSTSDVPDNNDAESNVDRGTDVANANLDLQVDTLVQVDIKSKIEEFNGIEADTQNENDADSVIVRCTDKGDADANLEVDTLVEHDSEYKVQKGNIMEKVSSLQADTSVSNDTEARVEESKDIEDSGTDVEADAEEMLAYLKQVWWNETGDLSENITALLSFLSTGEGVAPVSPPQELVDALRCRHRDFCGRLRNGQGEKKWVDILLRQLCFNYLRDLEQQQIASIHSQVTEANNTVEDFEADDALASLNSVLSDLESHIDAVKSSKRNTILEEDAGAVHPKLAPRHMGNSAGPVMHHDFGVIDYAGPRRSIGCGELYSTSRWEMLEKNSACRLKNKLVLTDVDEVETVAVILKVDQEGNRAALDSDLCVLNNEKPSALKTRASEGKNRRVKFMLKQESAGESGTNNNMRPQQPETSAICCWLC